MCSRIAKIEEVSLGRRASTVKRYRKTNGTKQLLAASRVGGIVSGQDPIVSVQVELMRKPILTDYERHVFSVELPLRPGLEHPKVHGTERLGFAKLDLYLNAKPKSVKPIRLVGEHAAAEQQVVEDFSAGGWIEPCPASEWVSKGFVVPEKEKGKWRLVVDYGQLNEATLPDAHPLPVIENMLENQSTQKIFTIVALSKGFHRNPMDRKERPYRRPAPEPREVRAPHRPGEGGGARTPRERKGTHTQRIRGEYQKGNRTEPAGRTDRLEVRTSQRG